MYQQISPHLSGITTWSNIPWYCIEYGSFHFRNQTLKSQNPFHIKLSHASYTVSIHWKQRIVNLTICRHCDYIRCHQWQHSCQNDNIMFSVIISIHDKILWIWNQGTALYVICYQGIKYQESWYTMCNMIPCHLYSVLHISQYNHNIYHNQVPHSY